MSTVIRAADLPVDENVGPPEAFLAALMDDLNTPRAAAELFALAVGFCLAGARRPILRL